MNSRYFVFDDIQSVDMDFHIVYFEGENYFKKSTYGGRGLTENYKRTHVDRHSTQENTMDLEFMVTKMDRAGNLMQWQEKDMEKLSRWLIKDDYKELSFGDSEDKVYYAILTDISELNLDRAGHGFVTVKFKTNASHAWTKERIHFHEVKEEKIIEVDVPFSVGEKYYPTIYITPTAFTPLHIKNLSTGQEIDFNRMAKGERIEYNCQYKFIRSEDPRENVFKEFNREWLYLRYGLNMLSLKGNAQIEIVTQLPIV